MIRKILAPTDLSELSGVRYALAAARDLDAEVTIYHVVAADEADDGDCAKPGEREALLRARIQVATNLSSRHTLQLLRLMGKDIVVPSWLDKHMRPLLFIMPVRI